MSKRDAVLGGVEAVTQPLVRQGNAVFSVQQDGLVSILRKQHAGWRALCAKTYSVY